MQTEKLDGYDGGWRTLWLDVVDSHYATVDRAYAEVERRFLY
jgi:hypothetical protein